jgi:hypothetical protein
MFRIVEQRREVKFPLVYAGMLDHEDSDNITNFQFSDGSQHRGVPCPPLPPPPGPATASVLPINIYAQKIPFYLNVVNILYL